MLRALALAATTPDALARLGVAHGVDVRVVVPRVEVPVDALGVQACEEVGNVDKNCEYGMYGKLNLENKLFKNKQLIEVGGRLVAHSGKAQIYSSLDGQTVRAYDIEIIKTNYKSSQSPKNLVFKVTDERLIQATGGIVQGMSGSPIVQDGKLIGAVTHVFVNDATKGFGVYIDSMIQQ